MELDDRMLNHIALMAADRKITELRNGIKLDDRDEFMVGNVSVADFKSITVSIKRSNYKRLWLFSQKKGITLSELIDSIIDTFDEDRYIKRKLVVPIKARKPNAIDIIAKVMLDEAKKLANSGYISNNIFVEKKLEDETIDDSELYDVLDDIYESDQDIMGDLCGD